MRFHGPEMPFERQYEVLEKIGTGADSSVFNANDLRTGRMVAIKIFKPEAEEIGQEEIAVHRAIHHPHVISYISDGAKNQRLALVMEHAKYGSLDRRLGKHGKMHPREVTEAVVQAGKGLGYLHTNGYIHGDVKSANILDTGNKVVLADFGSTLRIGKPIERTKFHTTIEFAAPEASLQGEMTKASDVYALGVVTFKLLTGNLIFPSETNTGVRRAHHYDTPPLLSHVLGKDMTGEHDILEEPMRRALEKNPTDRPALDEYLELLKEGISRGLHREKKVIYKHPRI